MIYNSPKMVKTAIILITQAEHMRFIWSYSYLIHNLTEMYRYYARNCLDFNEILI